MADKKMNEEDNRDVFEKALDENNIPPELIPFIVGSASAYLGGKGLARVMGGSKKNLEGLRRGRRLDAIDKRLQGMMAGGSSGFLAGSIAGDNMQGNRIGDRRPSRKK